eukprot:SAG11_NODE_1715_length_4396_cov_3.282290_2_plen_166_part_00
MRRAPDSGLSAHSHGEKFQCSRTVWWRKYGWVVDYSDPDPSHDPDDSDTCWVPGRKDITLTTIQNTNSSKRGYTSLKGFEHTYRGKLVTEPKIYDWPRAPEHIAYFDSMGDLPDNPLPTCMTVKFGALWKLINYFPNCYKTGMPLTGEAKGTDSLHRAGNEAWRP